MSNTNTNTATALEKLINKRPLETLRALLDQCAVWNVIELTEEQHIAKLHALINNLPLANRCSYVIAVLEVWEQD
jgi:hypothetical protein